MTIGSMTRSAGLDKVRYGPGKIGTLHPQYRTIGVRTNCSTNSSGPRSDIHKLFIGFSAMQPAPNGGLLTALSGSPRSKSAAFGFAPHRTLGPITPKLYNSHAA